MKVNRCIIIILRILLAAVFIFSGFVKAVDPWGTAIKIGEYLSAFGMGWLDGVKFVASIVLSGFELMLGLTLLLGLRLKLSSLLTMLFMACMTILTLYSAIAEPVSDCGCFGDVLKLSNWATFFKNLVLLPISVIVWKNVARQPVFTLKELVALCIVAFVSFGIGATCYRHLPLIDFLPYKVGTDLRATQESQAEQADPQVVYRDIQTGREQIFELSDTTWYDSDRWEWVETIEVGSRSGIRASTRDFAIYDGDRDVTDDYIFAPGRVMMICALDITDIKGKCKAILEEAREQAYGSFVRVICLTSTPLSQVPYLEIGEESVPCFNVDVTTLKTMLRAKVGVVMLKDGVITHKANCRDVMRKGVLKFE